ncbi:hypothetical protein M758_UG324000 [Ceratodon purpureus]|nr:hypothetical protein M758_UG324000 [Ceratodon purpureus]
MVTRLQDPIRAHKIVWILHLEHHGTAVAQGTAGVHYKMAKSKILVTMPCEVGVQWVHVQNVFIPGINPMYSSKQKAVRIMEDAISRESGSDGWIMWNTDYLREIL